MNALNPYSSLGTSKPKQNGQSFTMSILFVFNKV